MKNAGIEATKVMMKSRPAKKAVFLRGATLDSCLVAARGPPSAKRTVGRTSDECAHSGPPFARESLGAGPREHGGPLAFSTPEVCGWPPPMCTMVCCKAMRGLQQARCRHRQGIRLATVEGRVAGDRGTAGWTLG